MPQTWTPAAGTGRRWSPFGRQSWTPGNAPIYPNYQPPAAPAWRLHARDAARRRVAELIVETFTANLRLNDVGTWAITTTDARTAELLTAPGAGLVAERNGRAICSGPVTAWDLTVDADVRTWEITGATDELWLAARITIPDPADADTEYATAAHQITGPAATALLGYVDAHAGPAALAHRQVAGLELGTDPGTGPTRTWRARMTPLLEVCQRIAAKADPPLVFELKQAAADDPDHPATALVLRVREPADTGVVFSPELGNVGAYSYHRHRGEANSLYAGGIGRRRRRLFVESVDAAGVAEWAARLEAFAEHLDAIDATIDTGAADADLLPGPDRISLADHGLAADDEVTFAAIRKTTGLAAGTVYYVRPIAEEQTLTITGSPTGGTFTLTYDGQTTGTIAYNATASTVAAALVALSNIGPGDVTVTGGPGPDTAWVVAFAGIADPKTLTANGGGLTGGTSPAATVEVTADAQDLFQVATEPGGTPIALGGAAGTATVLADAWPDYFDADDHGLANGTRVYVTDVTDTTGILDGTTGYVRDATANRFRLAATAGGAPIALGGLGGPCQVIAFTDLAADATADLLELRGGWQYDLEVLPLQYEWPADYDLGDTVNVIVDQVTRREQVREVTVTVEPSGETISPTIGTETASRARIVAGAAAGRLARRLAAQLRRDEAAT